MVEIRLFDPHLASQAAWAEFHRFRRLRAEEDEPGEPVLKDAEFEHNARRQWPLNETRRLIAQSAGQIVGSLGFTVRRSGTPDHAEFAPYVWAWGGVLRSHRRQGIATALLRRLLAFMQEHEKTTLTFDSHLADGHGFAAAIGAVEKHRTVENRLILAGLDWTMLDRWQAAGVAPGSKLGWEVHAGRVPMDRLVALLPQFSALLREVPLGALDMPPLRWELPRVAAWYEEMDRHGGEHLLVMLTDGDVVAAMCEASWDARFPDRVYQALTAVAGPWRGQGLGRAVKAAMLRLLRERHPQLRLMVTSNAEINAAMLSINNRLGFSVFRRDSSYQVGRDALASWLGSR